MACCDGGSTWPVGNIQNLINNNSNNNDNNNNDNDNTNNNNNDHNNNAFQLMMLGMFIPIFQSKS